jgi:hypothetical protein
MWVGKAESAQAESGKGARIDSINNFKYYRRSIPARLRANV